MRSSASWSGTEPWVLPMASDAHSPDLWDGIATRYDSLGPDQALRDPALRQAWAALVEHRLPAPRCTILDVGCGTGSLSLLLAERGHDVTGIDFAPAMIEVARAKSIAAGTSVTFVVQDAIAPQLPRQSVDAVIGRQVLWALPDRHTALRNWAELLRPGGCLLLIEGRFASGNGMSEHEVRAVFPPTMSAPAFTDLSNDAGLWGAPLRDQRLLVTATRR